jgi:hypothetical protein
VPLLAGLNGYFEGQHDKVVAEMPFSVPLQDLANMTPEEKIIAKGNSQQPLKEVDRLSYVI